MKRLLVLAVSLPLWCAAECGTPPAFFNQRTISEEEACQRVAAALRRKCGDGLNFDCKAWLNQQGQDCGGPQRESDVARCEELVSRARTCEEAQDTTCGMTCPASPLVPGLP